MRGFDGRRTTSRKKSQPSNIESWAQPDWMCRIMLVRSDFDDSKSNAGFNRQTRVGGVKGGNKKDHFLGYGGR